MLVKRIQKNSEANGRSWSKECKNTVQQMEGVGQKNAETQQSKWKELAKECRLKNIRANGRCWSKEYRKYSKANGRSW